MGDSFYGQARDYANRRNMKWFNHNLMRVLEQSKEKQARDVDKSIYLAKKLEAALNAKVAEANPVEQRVFPLRDDAELMRPVEPQVTEVLMKARTKGGTDRYLKLRYHKSPEDKFYFRAVSSWDYGWGHSAALNKRDVYRPKLALIKETLYRTRNVAPDPPHYNPPAQSDVTFCTQFSI